LCASLPLCRRSVFPFARRTIAKLKRLCHRYVVTSFRCVREGTGAVCGRSAPFALASQIVAGALHLIQQVIQEL
jgi:hypothetical protein